MERRLDDLQAEVVRLATAEEYRYRQLAWHLQLIHARLEQPQPNGAWLKIPLALCLPIAIFLLMLAVTGDLRAALTAAVRTG
jgi:hypothetical protein